MALEDRGAEVVTKHVGVEPTGDPFNSISVEEETKRPFNPMVNAGAIVTTSLLSGETGVEQHSRLLTGLSRFAGRQLVVDERVFEAERETGDRNRAIGYFMRALDMGPPDVEAALDLYFRQCSVLVDCCDLGVMAATLANRGVNPLTGERALEEGQVVRVLSVMNTCGMYDFTGEWVFRVGIPAKSGVAGAIIAVVPGQLGFAVFSPPLDRRGNSVRGTAVCEQLSQHFNLHVNRAHSSGPSVVRRSYRATTVRSKRDRGAVPTEALRRGGEMIAVFELQGDLFFATAEALSRAVEPELGPALYLVLGCRRVGYIDHGAFEVLADLVELAQASGLVAVLAEASAMLENDMVPASIAALRSFGDLDSALEWCEDRVLEALAVPSEPTETVLGDQELLHGLDAGALAVLTGRTEAQSFARGTHVFSEGDPADRMFFLIAGRVSVQLPVGDHTRRLASIGPGSAFGEMALLDEGSRSSTVVADEDCECRALSRHALTEMEHGPGSEIVPVLFKNLAKSLSRRLRETNEMVRALE